MSIPKLLCTVRCITRKVFTACSAARWPFRPALVHCNTGRGLACHAPAIAALGWTGSSAAVTLRYGQIPQHPAPCAMQPTSAPAPAAAPVRAAAVSSQGRAAQPLGQRSSSCCCCSQAREHARMSTAAVQEPPHLCALPISRNSSSSITRTSVQPGMCSCTARNSCAPRSRAGRDIGT